MRFLQKLGIDHPIILAPMGGGPSTPELVAAVANAGGLGSIAAAYLTPEQIGEEFQRVRELTSKPLAVNLFAGGRYTSGQYDPQPMIDLLTEIHASLALPAPVAPEPKPDPFPAQLEAVLEARPEVFSFTFGVPGRDAMSALRERGIKVMGTATTLQEARLLAEAGVEAIIAQGAEAGAHRGTFAGSFEDSMVPTLELVREIVAAVPLPVVASGGIMDGREIAAALAVGASAVQLGTAFLACPESGASEPYRRAILEAKQDTTVITRAFSGRPARGLVNTFIEILYGHEDAILPYPLQNDLTRSMRAAAAKAGDAGYLSLWAGRGVTRARAMPAGELVRTLVQEMKADTRKAA